MKPNVVLIINCFNSERFLNETVENLIQQSYKNLTLLFVDNKSTDKTLTILRKYNKKSSKIKIYILERHLNLVEARNEALNYLKKNLDFDFFAFCDSDDLWDANWVSSLVNIGKGFDLIFCNGFEFTIDNNGKKSYKSAESTLAIKKYDAFSSPLFLQSAIFSKNILNTLGDKFLDLNLPMLYDIDLFLRIQKQSFKYLHVSKKLFFYRIHTHSLTTLNPLSILKERYYITRKNNLPKMIFLIKLFFYVFRLNKIFRFILKIAS
tara:strand:+ start:7950 stop:8741 length:792 start_codon:yes stop_codon:yes gene_type:complete